jgi:serine/threonine protein kinase
VRRFEPAAEQTEGSTLAELGPRRLSTHHILTIARQLATALEAAHSKGVIHRDLKPANIKLQQTPGPRSSGVASRSPTEIFVKVLDFGLAKAFVGDGSSDRGSEGPATTLMSRLWRRITGNQEG